MFWLFKMSRFSRFFPGHERVRGNWYSNGHWAGPWRKTNRGAWARAKKKAGKAGLCCQKEDCVPLRKTRRRLTLRAQLSDGTPGKRNQQHRARDETGKGGRLGNRICN